MKRWTRWVVGAVAGVSLFLAGMAVKGIGQEELPGCVIHFSNGKTLAFSYERNTNPAGVNILQMLLSNDKWVLNVDGRTCVVPVDNIDYIEFAPSLPSIADRTLKGFSEK